MNFLKLFQRLRNKRPDESASSGHGDLATAQATPHPTGLVIDRLDIQRAIILHLEWCVVFNDHLGADSSLPQATEPLPDAKSSGLGQWLAQTRQRPLGRHPLFAELEQAQRQFHELADRALALTRNGHMSLASTLLNTDFERSRTRVLEILRSLQNS
ncbi:CZB domain-containing protein [Hydrogenophaga sp.]|uniref:CZB domain-containing protein n=1 Tax=Hydrogenophaga sp. TaxID=1904254 RepID=UPI003F6A5C0F